MSGDACQRQPFDIPSISLGVEQIAFVYAGTAKTLACNMISDTGRRQPCRLLKLQPLLLHNACISV